MHEAVGIVRNPDHLLELEAAGMRGVEADLETGDVAALAAIVRDADAVAFALLDAPASVAQVRELVGGTEPIDAAVTALLGGERPGQIGATAPTPGLLGHRAAEPGRNRRR